MAASWLRYLVVTNFLYANISPFSAYACEKSSQWLLKEKLCQHRCQEAYMCITDCYDMILAIKLQFKQKGTIGQKYFRELIVYFIEFTHRST